MRSSRVQFVVRRWMVAAVVMGTWGLAAPGLASAAQSFSITSPSGGSSFPANGNVPYTTTMNFDTSAGAPQRALIATSPGVLAALSANPSCIQTRQITTACQIGSGSATLTGLAPAPLKAYLVPATDPAHDVAGVDLIAAVGNPTHAEIQLKQNSAGNVAAVLNVDFSGAPPGITGSTLTVNQTLNGKPFTRMPSNCNPGPSTLTIQYAGGKSETTSAAPDFNITGCSALPFSPQFHAVVSKDAGDDGVKVVTTITQSPSEAATAGNGLTLPWPAVAPNFSGGLVNQNTTTPVGSVTAVSPLLPTPLTGNAYLTGTPLGPTLTLLFPAPNALKLVGTVDLPTHTVTFNGVPDVPQTSLVVTLFGGVHALEVTTCQPPDGTASGSFTGQNGKTATVSQHVTVSGCPPPKKPAPTISTASLSGGKKPVLRFTVTQSSGAPKLKSFTVTLPAGLKFNPLKVVGGLALHGVKKVSLRGNRLSVTFKQPLARIAVRLSAPLLVAGKHRPKHPRLRITVTDATGHATSLSTLL
jgi:hypothetical protein